MEVGLNPSDFMLDGDPVLPQKGGGGPSPIFGPFLLWPNGWMDQDALGMEVGLIPGGFVFDGDPAPPAQKGGIAAPIFGLFLLWPNSWMHRDATWCGGRPQPRRLYY